MGTHIEKEAGSSILKSYGEFFKTLHQDFLSHCDYEMWEENKVLFPIQVCMEPTESIPITKLVSSDNTLMTKVLGVLTSLCAEVINLKTEATERYFPFLAVYDEYDKSDITSQMEIICSMNSFYMRCDDTLHNLCSQVFAVFMEGIVNLNGIQLHYVINHVGELFTVIVLMELMISHTSLPKKWNVFSKTLRPLQHSPEKLGLSENSLKAMVGAMDNITIKIMNDDIAQKSLQNLLTLRKSMVDKNCSNVSAEFNQYLKQAFLNLDKLVQEKPTVTKMYKCIKINCLFVLSSHLFGNNDKKMFKTLNELNLKAHSIHLAGTTIWFPEQFLQRHVPALCDSYGKIPQTMLKVRQAYVISKKATLAKDLVLLQSVCTQWAFAAEEVFSKNHYKLNASEMNQHAKVLLEGLDVVSGINHSTLTFINLHLSLGIPLSKSVLKLLFQIIDILKGLQNVIIRNYNQIINSINMIIHHLVFQATSSVQEVRKSLMTDKNYANKRLDELTCVVIAEQALKGTTTVERNIAANIALSFVPDSTYFEDSYARLCVLLEKVQTLRNFTKSFENLCNCSWILWHQHIIPIYFEQTFSIQLNAVKVKYFLMVLEDCFLYLHRADSIFKEQKSKEFLCEMRNLINERILESTCQNIETNLRLHIHSHLQLDVVNPFVSDMTKKILLAIDVLKLNSVYMCVVPTVEHYLSTMYYNLTTVVLSDWKTYGEMRQMAKLKFNLNTVQDHLPTQTLEQGLDVLEIMRNIHVFVSKYLYNLNNQIFIEKSSNNKHLNSINIRHIANSIRTHGTGIMNTTVNFTYQFLKKKFFTFSQFMYDEHIKSRLIQDLRRIRENSPGNRNMYPYRNAEKFNKGIRVLGTVGDGQTYLDLFRDLISQIGNAMGYVRMIRSGGRHCCSDATIFLPELELTNSFVDMCHEDSLTQKCKNSAEVLDNTIVNLVTNFLQGTEYFKLLVEAFAPVFRNPKNLHLKNFYIIVPPLTLNFVEHMILSKDKMTKKNKVGAAFTDDGFAMGVAYILKLLDQDTAFESLHWFDSVWTHLSNERKILEDQKIKGTVQLQQALALTDKKLKIVEEEYKLLYYSLTSARIFFR